MVKFGIPTIPDPFSPYKETKNRSPRETISGPIALYYVSHFFINNILQVINCGIKLMCKVIIDCGIKF